MKLSNAASSKFGPIIPQSLQSHINFVTMCELSKEESSCFTLCLEAFSRTLCENGVSLPDTSATCCIINSESLTLCDIEPDTLGAYAQLIIYPIHRWRAKKLDSVQRIACILEELCHYGYSTFDEDLVKDHVVEVASRIDPVLTFDVLYPGCCVG